ncbi:hypothetical protein EDC04DRAFT_3136891 [Pisolithus marmoratus]|nr:hypothetical protein EDC04DRAFT_3136891 [Pisolithus marmoratus]
MWLSVSGGRVPANVIPTRTTGRVTACRRTYAGMKESVHLEVENQAGKSRCSPDTGDDLFHCSRKRSPQDLLHLGSDDSGYVQGKIFMCWPPANGTRRFNLEVSEDGSINRFEVALSEKCFQEVEVLPFRPNDHICLALKGVEVESRKKSSAPYLLPLTLRYTSGVAIKYLSGTNEGKTINTWQEHASMEDWYSPGRMRRVSDVIMDDVSTSGMPAPLLGLGDIDRSTKQPLGDQVQRSDRCTSSGHRDAKCSTNQIDRVKLTKLEKKKLKRQAQKMRGSRTSSHVEHDAPKPIHLNGDGGERVVLPQAPHDVTSVYTNDGGDDKILPTVPEDSGSVQTSRSTQLRTDTHPGESGLSMGSVFRTEMGDQFSPLNALRSGHEIINVIGVVLQANAPKRTSTNEWSRSFTIVDPSITSSSSLSAVGVGVTCFQKTYVEWLPQVAEGDVVMLRKLKISEFSGVLKAIGYADKLRWARLRKKQSATGLGYFFTPFWTPRKDGVELQYCRKLLAWWKGLRGTEKEVICVQRTTRPSKEHRLLCEASPEVVPDGFFNCTVEILHKFHNHGGSYTVYVTDYTSNPHTYPLQPHWCPPGLCDRIFPIEMWDEATGMAQLMNAGEYWYLYNVRARLNRSGYLEGRMQTASKVIQLSETQLDKFPHLKALVTRKQSFSEGGLSAGLPNSFPYKLFQDVDDTNTFFSCVVEVGDIASTFRLSAQSTRRFCPIDYDPRDGTTIYATDYTYNPSFPRQVSAAEWARCLDFRVLRIKLDDAQSQVARDICMGSFYRILNLRLIRRGDGSNTHGRLGGEDRLFLPLTDQQAELQSTLKLNKDKWKRELMLDRACWATPPTPQPVTVQLAPTGSSTIHEVLSSTTCSSTFTVVARTVDFYPFLLEDACVLRCMKCQADVPLTFKACPRCDDMLETHCRWCYCLYLRLEDDAGDNLNVSLCDKECTLLQDTPADDFHYDRGAFRNFLAKLKPVIGNLAEVHDAWSANKEKEIESPRMHFTIESWAIGDDERGYGLLSCTPA